MEIKIEDVQHLAQLSRLHFDEEEQQQMRQDLSNIVKYVNKLDEIDFSDMEAREHILPLVNVFRKDEVRPSLSNEKALANAPEKESMCFKVEQLMEDE